MSQTETKVSDILRDPASVVSGVKSRTDKIQKGFSSAFEKLGKQPISIHIGTQVPTAPETPTVDMPNEPAINVESLERDYRNSTWAQLGNLMNGAKSIKDIQEVNELAERLFASPRQKMIDRIILEFGVPLRDTILRMVERDFAFTKNKKNRETTEEG
jgi:hypothetical protein